MTPFTDTPLFPHPARLPMGRRVARFGLLCLLASGLSGCGGASEAPVDASGLAAGSASGAPLDFIAPDPGQATLSAEDLDSDVAPYVMASGAGASRLSPDGRTVATVLSLTGTRQVYVIDVEAEDPQSTLQQVSRGSGVTFFEFSPDGSLLYGADNNGDERENYWRVEPDAGAETGWGEPKLLLPATETGFRAFGGFSRDGRWAVFSSTERNGQDFDVYFTDTRTGETRRIWEGEGGNYVQAVSPSARTVILSEAVGEDADRLFVLDVASGTRRVLSDPSPRANHTDAGVVYLDENRIILAQNADREFAGLRTYVLGDDFKIGASLSSADTRDTDAVEVCNGRLVATTNKDGFSDLHIAGRKADLRLPLGVYSIDCAGDRLLVRASAANVPGDLFVFPLDETPRRVFRSDYSGLDPRSLIQPESVRINARDGVELQGLLYLPNEEARRGADEKPPVVFLVHGGPTAQSRPSYNATAQYLLSKGIAVFQPNVRGSTGFGRTYTTLDDGRKRLDSVRDLVDMLAWLEADGRVDTSRAAVQGGSYGGYMVNAVLADYPDAFDAGIALFGVGDWVGALEVASPQLKASDIIEYGDISDPEWREFYTAISPVAKAGNIRVPVLYSHGAMDPRIDIAETEIMVRALRENGVRADYVRFPDEGHGWRKLSNRLFYERVQAEFLEDVLK